MGPFGVRADVGGDAEFKFGRCEHGVFNRVRDGGVWSGGADVKRRATGRTHYFSASHFADGLLYVPVERLSGADEGVEFLGVESHVSDGGGDLVIARKRSVHHARRFRGAKSLSGVPSDAAIHITRDALHCKCVEGVDSEG